jgi:hypothetical protein
MSTASEMKKKEDEKAAKAKAASEKRMDEVTREMQRRYQEEMATLQATHAGI